MSEFEESVLIDASVERVWETLADIGTIALFRTECLCRKLSPDH